MHINATELARRLGVDEEYARKAIEQVQLHFSEYMRVAQRGSVDDVVRVRCAYEALYEIARFLVHASTTSIGAMRQPDAYARAAVEHAATVLQLTPEEARQARALNEWGLSGVPAEPPLTVEEAVHLAERVLAESLGRG
ncbi:Uncharacterised protein [Burkholderia pseudomallei]|nr:Uncharacterised protein [Burkholderia pseudomallei]